MDDTPENTPRPGRPSGRPLMLQKWGRLLFMHWPVAAEPLGALLPRGVELDLYQGQAWIGVIPFTMWGVRASFLPPIPGTASFHELNVRTYVRAGGVPGVWFFSLDASSRLAVHAARLAYHLPYYSARMDLRQEGETISYRSVRTHRNAPPARFEATWRQQAPLPESRPGTLQHFLTERYCLYTERWGRIFRGRIHHPPWPLREARLESLASTMVESHGLPTPQGEPLLYYADQLAVQIWPLEARPVFSRQKLAEQAAAAPEPVARIRLPQKGEPSSTTTPTWMTSTIGPGAPI